jgi:hypothetical protein
MTVSKNPYALLVELIYMIVLSRARVYVGRWFAAGLGSTVRRVVSAPVSPAGVASVFGGCGVASLLLSPVAVPDCLLLRAGGGARF